MSFSLSQADLSFNAVFDFLRLMPPLNGSAAEAQSAEDWAAAETEHIAIGDVLFILQTTGSGQADPSKGIGGIGVSEQDRFSSVGMILVFRQDAGYPMGFMVTATSYDIQFVETVLTAKADEARQANKGFYYLQARPAAQLNATQLTELSEMHKWGNSGSRSEAPQNLGDPARAFLQHIGVEFDAQAPQVLPIEMLATAIFEDDGGKTTGLANLKSILCGVRKDPSLTAAHKEHLDASRPVASPESDATIDSARIAGPSGKPAPRAAGLSALFSDWREPPPVKPVTAPPAVQPPPLPPVVAPKSTGETSVSPVVTPGKQTGETTRGKVADELASARFVATQRYQPLFSDWTDSNEPATEAQQEKSSPQKSASSSLASLFPDWKEIEKDEPPAPAQEAPPPKPVTKTGEHSKSGLSSIFSDWKDPDVAASPASTTEAEPAAAVAPAPESGQSKAAQEESVYSSWKDAPAPSVVPPLPPTIVEKLKIADRTTPPAEPLKLFTDIIGNATPQPDPEPSSGLMFSDWEEPAGILSENEPEPDPVPGPEWHAMVTPDIVADAGIPAEALGQMAAAIEEVAAAVSPDLSEAESDLAETDTANIPMDILGSLFSSEQQEEPVAQQEQEHAGAAEQPPAVAMEAEPTQQEAHNEPSTSESASTLTHGDSPLSLDSLLSEMAARNADAEPAAELNSFSSQDSSVEVGQTSSSSEPPQSVPVPPPAPVAQTAPVQLEDTSLSAPVAGAIASSEIQVELNADSDHRGPRLPYASVPLAAAPGSLTSSLLDLKLSSGLVAGVSGGLIAKLEQQAQRAGVRLEEKLIEIQERLLKDRIFNLRKVQIKEEASDRNISGLKSVIFRKVNFASDEVKEEIKNSANQGRDALKQFAENAAYGIEQERNALLSEVQISPDQVIPLAINGEPLLLHMARASEEGSGKLKEEFHLHLDQMDSIEKAHLSIILARLTQLKARIEISNTTVESEQQACRERFINELTVMRNFVIDKLDSLASELCQRVVQTGTSLGLNLNMETDRLCSELLLARMASAKQSLPALMLSLREQLRTEFDNDAESRLAEIEPLLAKTKEEIEAISMEAVGITSSSGNLEKEDLERVLSELTAFFHEKTEEFKALSALTSEELANIDNEIAALSNPASIESEPEIAETRVAILQRLQKIGNDLNDHVNESLRGQIANMEDRARVLQEDLISSMEADAYSVRKTADTAIARLREKAESIKARIKATQDQYIS